MSQELWYIRDRNKVTGPFTLEQLDALRRRGQLARFHEVSQDRKTWARASTLTALSTPSPMVVLDHPAPTQTPASQPPSPPWYYSSDDSPVGPIPVSDFLDLVRRGTVTPDMLVWREGLSAWVPLRDIQIIPGTPNPSAPGAASTPGTSSPRATPPRRKNGTAIVVALAVVTFGVGAFWATKQEKNPQAPTPLPTSSPEHIIHSMDDSAHLSAAVGLVLCGWTQTDFDGTKTEVCLSTGTCFAVSAKGFLITNRHVINDISKLINAKAMRAELEETTKAQIEPRIWVFFKHKKYEATIRHESDEFDLAVLKIQPDLPMPYFKLATNDDVTRGTSVFALGFPEASRTPLSGEEALQRLIREQKTGVRVESHFQDSNFDYVITDGIVSLVRHDASAVKIEHTAKISAGNSGGPLVKSDGTVLGINTLIAKGGDEATSTYVALAVGALSKDLNRHVPDLLAP